MSKIIFIMAALLVASSLTACTGTPAQSGHTSQQQRDHAREGQGELSTEVHR